MFWSRAAQALAPRVGIWPATSSVESDFDIVWNLSIDGFVKSTKTVMPDLIPAKDGIFDRHPELIEITGFRLFTKPSVL